MDEKEEKKDFVSFVRKDGTRKSPTKWNQKIAERFLDRMIEGESVFQICKDKSMPSYKTVMRWVGSARRQGHEFYDNFTRARELQADYLFDKLESLAAEADTVIVGDDKSDNARVQAKKLQVDTLRWRISKMLPKKYGEKLDVTSGNKPIPASLLSAVHDENKPKKVDVPRLLDNDSNEEVTETPKEN